MSIIPQAMVELLIHGVKYVYPPEIGSIERGVPTYHSAPVFKKEFVQSDEDVYIWPDINGKKRGRSVTPLSKNAGKAALVDDELYDMLALIDALRIGRARERNLAAKKLKSMVEKCIAMATYRDSVDRIEIVAEGLNGHIGFEMSAIERARYVVSKMEEIALYI